MIIPNLGFGGAQRVFHDLVLCLNQNYDVFECVFNFDGATSYAHSRQIFSLDVPGGTNIFEKVWYFLQRIHRLRRLKHQLNVDFTISHLEGADYVNVLSFTKEKTILCVHGSKIHDIAISGALGWVRKKILLPLLYKRASMIVAVAQGIKNELTTVFGIPGEKIQVINNGFDIKGIRDQSKDLIGDEFHSLYQRPVLITHGRLAKEKDHQFLIKLLSHKTIKGRLNLVVLGDGPLLKNLIDFSNLLGHRTYHSTGLDGEGYDVFFLGYQSNPFKFLRKGSIFVFPSLFEGFPMALVEAMACGLPIVARNCPYGPSEILDIKQDSWDSSIFSEYGILISNNLSENERLDVWAETINTLLRDSKLKSNYEAKSVVRSNAFEMRYFCRSWESIFTGLK